ncbi:MAG TPA: pectinesterase family protein [Bryobacteraceae bacterium]|jgi:pectinesterase|nr:pectinesterase family protein [Bryobacteraceae bacterium]
MPTRRAFLATAGLLSAAARAQSSGEAGVVRAVVAQDGSGDFPTVQRAVDHVLDHPPRDVSRVILDIRPGVYRERVKVPRDSINFTFAGRDAASTAISASMSAAAAGGTFFSSIVEVTADGFEARNITFENSFGVGSQAVAISLHSDRATFHNCRFSGWQDTLYASSGRQYYRDCFVEGHVDFIFGNAAAVFDQCEIHSRGSGYIAASSRTTPDEPTGLIFRGCRLTGVPGLLRLNSAAAAAGETPFPPKDSGAGVYLGRPWRDYARTVYIECRMGEHIRPDGWGNWGIPAREKTAWFGEAGSSGPGANPAGRVEWAHRLTPAEAAEFAPAVFLKGRDGWNPAR